LSGNPFAYVHTVGFEEVDAAGIAYFARFFGWCHDAMAAMLAPLEGGYRGMIERRLGLPTVHVEADFASPLKYGDEVRILVSVERMGTSSIALRFGLERGVNAGDVHVATIRHVVVLTNLDDLKHVPLPDALRALLAQHQAEAS
jgi:4-hydroxybenzoyl-CoA thioesterase